MANERETAMERRQANRSSARARVEILENVAYTIEQVVELTGLSRYAVRKCITSGMLRAAALPSGYLILGRELLRMLSGRRQYVRKSETGK